MWTYETLVDTAEAHCVDLTHVDGFGLQELLECDAVLCCFTRCDSDSVWLERFADCGVAQDVVGVGGLFDEDWFELYQPLHVFDSLWNAPYLWLI